MVLVGGLLAIIGSAYVYVKNQHVAREDIKRGIQQDILKFNEESEQLQRRIDAKLLREEIHKFLNSRNSRLDKIPRSAITTVSQVEFPGVGTRRKGGAREQ